MIDFRLNGTPVTVDHPDSTTTLLDFLRARGYTGVKEGCAEGECGACAVVLLVEDAGGAPRYRAVNSCLLLLPMVHGRSVLTVEGIASGDRLHPVQQALVAHGASQCGYCTAGFVMSLFAEYYRPGRKGVDLEAIVGNLCRCTGYHSIRDAARSLAAPSADDPFLAELAGPAPTLPGLWPTGSTGSLDGRRSAASVPASDVGEPGSAAPAAAGKPAADAETNPAPEAETNLAPELVDKAPAVRRATDGDFPSAAAAPSVPLFYRPTCLADLLAILQEHPEARLVAGGTDVAVEFNLLGARWPVLVSVEAVPDLHVLEERPEFLEIGAAVTLTDLEERLGDRVPLLDQLFPLFASRLVRNRATLGGNLATASPVGDGSLVLLALDAEVRAVGAEGERLIPLASFFTGYRRTALQPGQVLRSIRIPLPQPRHARFYKVAKRQRDDISIVAAAFALDLDASGRVERARLAFGGVAPTPVRARAAEASLLGQPWNAHTVTRAAAILAGELRPIDDHRGSAAYRRALVQNLFCRFFLDGRPATRAAVS